MHEDIACHEARRNDNVVHGTVRQTAETTPTELDPCEIIGANAVGRRPPRHLLPSCWLHVCGDLAQASTTNATGLI